MKTGEVIKQILKEKGIKMSWLAEQLKLSSSTLYNRLDEDLKVNFILEICKVINISLDDVFKKYDEMLKEKEK